MGTGFTHLLPGRTISLPILEGLSLRAVKKLTAEAERQKNFPSYFGGTFIGRPRNLCTGGSIEHFPFYLEGLSGCDTLGLKKLTYSPTSRGLSLRFLSMFGPTNLSIPLPVQKGLSSRWLRAVSTAGKNHLLTFEGISLRQRSRRLRHASTRKFPFLFLEGLSLRRRW